MKTIYVAHPFRGDEIVNAGKVARICRELHKDYPDYLFVSPIHAFSWFRDDHDGALEHCLRMLARCDELWLFGEWQNSAGCMMERDAARDLGIEIFAPIRLGDGMKFLLLLSGKAQSGKDTFADSIASLGFHKYSFAKALKDEALSGGWDGAKDERGRVLLQQLGTVWRHYEPDHWIRRLQESISHDFVAITDCRYRNEISLMQTWGRENGYSVVTVRINRTDHDNGLSPEARSHPSECELDGEDFDVTVYNYGPLLDFCANARWVAKCLLFGSWWV